MDDIYFLGIDVGGANLKIIGLNKKKKLILFLKKNVRFGGDYPILIKK